MSPTTYLVFCTSVNPDYSLNVDISDEKNPVYLPIDHHITILDENSPNQELRRPIYRVRLAGLDINEPRMENYITLITHTRERVRSNNGWFFMRINLVEESNIFVTLYDPVTMIPLNEELFKHPTADGTGYAGNIRMSIGSYTRN